MYGESFGWEDLSNKKFQEVHIIGDSTENMED